MNVATEKALIDINYMTLKEWPKAHEVWGDDGFERINQLLDKAVHLVGRKEPNESIIYAGLSENKSKAGKMPVVFIDCDSLNRYHISERDIKSSKLPKPDRASAFK